MFSRRRPHEVAGSIREYHRAGFETFVGYYDISPLSDDGTKLLAHAVRGRPKVASGGTAAHLGYFDTTTGSFREIYRSTAWCWQMGSRLPTSQWYSQSGDRQILFNATVDGHHSTMIYDLDTETVIRRFSQAFYEVAKTGTYGLALNFSRLGRLRVGYGYIDVADPTETILAPGNDGLWKVDLGTENASMLVSYQDLAEFEPVESMAGSQHYINLVMASPQANNIAFLHLWVEASGISHVRLMGITQHGEALCILANDPTPSHGWWLDDYRFLVTMVSPDGTTEYRVVKSGQCIGVLDNDLPDRDGHPSLSPNRKYLLTDSYPDRYGEQHLDVFDFARRRLVSLGAFISGWSYIDAQPSVYVLDLDHPRDLGSAVRMLLGFRSNSDRCSLYSITAFEPS